MKGVYNTSMAIRMRSLDMSEFPETKLASSEELIIRSSTTCIYGAPEGT